MQFFTGTSDFASGALGMVELTASYLNDRQYKQWAMSELKEWVNQAQFDIGIDVMATFEDLLMKEATTPAVAGQTYYALPSDAARLLGVEVADSLTDREPNSLVQVPLSDRDFYRRMQAANAKGNIGFFYIRGTDFRILPELSTSSQSIRVFYVGRLTPLVAGTDVSAIPVEHHELVVLGAAQRANAKFDRSNGAIDRLYAHQEDQLLKALFRRMVTREQRIVPWHGSFGPDDSPYGGQTI